MTTEKEAVLVEESDSLLPVKFVSMDVAEVFTPVNMDFLLSALREKAESFTPDVSTPKGRKEIVSFAAKFSKSKTFLDGKGKDHLAEMKEKAKAIDSQRKRFRDTCDELRDKVRLPYTEYEEAEKARIEAEETAREIEKAHEEALHENDLFNRQKEIERKEAEFAKIEAERIRKEEEARLEKERAEREEKIRAEAEAKAKREAEEAARIEREKKDREIAEAKERAEKAERDRLAAEQKAKEEQERAVRLAEERAAAEARRIKEEEARIAEESRISEEKKAANKRHRAKVKDEACKAISATCKMTPEQADWIFDAISNGEVPHITVNY